MLSNQGQAVNLRDGSPLYPFNFIQHRQSMCLPARLLLFLFPPILSST